MSGGAFPSRLVAIGERHSRQDRYVDKGYALRPAHRGHGDAREDVADRLDPTATDFVRASVAHVLDPLPSRARSAGDGVGVPGRIVPARLCKQVAP